MTTPVSKQTTTTTASPPRGSESLRARGLSKFTTRQVLLGTAAFALLLGGAATAQAALITPYTNQAAWSAASGPSTLETFSSATPGTTTGTYGPTVFNGFTITAEGNGNTLGIGSGSFANGSNDTAIPASFAGQQYFGWGNLAGGRITSITLSFTQPTTAFAFDWFNTDVTDQYTLTLSLGDAFSGPPFTRSPGGTASSGFFGVISDTPFTSATITNTFNGGFISTEGFDNVRVSAFSAASATTAVPEPNTVIGAFFMLGVCAVGLFKRFTGKTAEEPAVA